jgi:isobutyryl-CoA mutase
VRYLAEIAEQGRKLGDEVERQAAGAATAQHCYEALRAIGDPELPAVLEPYPSVDRGGGDPQSGAGEAPTLASLRRRYNVSLEDLGPEALGLLRSWDERIATITAETYSYKVRDREVTGENYRRSLSQQLIPKIAPPRFDGWGDRLRFLLKENLPGSYPYTGGVFPYRRAGEDPTRMFAGEGTPERTNRRFHYLSQGQPAARLSTAFDSVTLYGEDPAERPDIYGKVGNSGVSIATLDDAKKLYSGFDLCAPSTSVSMTINGPAPIILAFFMNTAIDQQVERSGTCTRRAGGRRRSAGSTRISAMVRGRYTVGVCRTATRGSALGCSACRVTWSWSPRCMSGSRLTRSRRCAEPSRPTSSRRTRRRTRASSRLSSRSR